MLVALGGCREGSSRSVPRARREPIRLGGCAQCGQCGAQFGGVLNHQQQKAPAFAVVLQSDLDVVPSQTKHARLSHYRILYLAARDTERLHAQDRFREGLVVDGISLRLAQQYADASARDRPQERARGHLCARRSEWCARQQREPTYDDG